MHPSKPFSNSFGADHHFLFFLISDLSCCFCCVFNLSRAYVFMKERSSCDGLFSSTGIGLFSNSIAAECAAIFSDNNKNYLYLLATTKLPIMFTTVYYIIHKSMQSYYYYGDQ